MPNVLSAVLRRALLVAVLAAPAAAVDIDWVTVGDPGNACDTQSQGCFGAVAQTYRIGTYEVSNAEYTEFLNAVDPTGANTLALYDANMSINTLAGGITNVGPPGSVYATKAGFEDLPVVYVSFYDALRFANWLHNGQGSGDTETGAYTLLGGTPEPSNGSTVVRNPGALVFVPSEDEWYKAAYYDTALTLYYDYAAGSDTAQTCDLITGDTGNSANCDFVEGAPTEGGAYGLSTSPNGTFDQGGNAYEWNEEIFTASNARGARGGSWTPGGSFGLPAAFRTESATATANLPEVGFRVAAVSGQPACSDGIDNDGDGKVDFGANCANPLGSPFDCGCDSAADTSEKDETGFYKCDDGVDNDSDGMVDLADPACQSNLGKIEETKCQDGVENDGDTFADFDGGESIHGACSGGTCPPGVTDPDQDGVADPDPQCVGKPFRNREGVGCGLGFEVAPLLLLLGWRRRATTRR